MITSEKPGMTPPTWEKLLEDFEQAAITFGESNSAEMNFHEAAMDKARDALVAFIQSSLSPDTQEKKTMEIRNFHERDGSPKQAVEAEIQARIENLNAQTRLINAQAKQLELSNERDSAKWK